MLGYDLNQQMEVTLDGIFIAKVISIDDPKALERVRVRVIGVHDMDNEKKENSIWAHHCAYSKQNSGEIPNVDDFLYVMFIQRNPQACVYLGWVRSIQG